MRNLWLCSYASMALSSSASTNLSAPDGTMVKNDKRISRRFQAKRSDYILYIEGSGAIRDLSLEGVFVLDTDPLPVDTKIAFSLRVSTHDIAVTGIVRRSVPEEGMVIQFTGMSSESVRRLKIHLASLVGAPERPPET